VRIRANLGTLGGIAFTSVILVVILFALVEATDWPYEARLLPWILGVPTAILCLVLLVRDSVRLARGTVPQENVRIMDIQTDDDIPLAVVVRRATTMFAWLFGLFAAIWLVGFLITIPAFIFLYLLVQGREPLRLCIVASVSMLAFTVVVFHHLLRVQWLRGVFPYPQEVVMEWLSRLF
jgi:hypothetical protein